MKNVLTLGIFVFLLGSLVSCKGDKGAKAAVGEEAKVAAAMGKDYKVDQGLSKIMWAGSKPAGSHNGTINVSEGMVAVKDGKVTGGSFTLDMNSISVLDLQGDEKAYLESHLKGSADDNADDFFNVSKHPTAKFEITKLTGLTNDSAASHLVYGNLTLKGISKEVGFKANIDISDSGLRVTSPKFTIDRTQWNIKYGSDKFFDNLKDKVISDDISLQINLVAK